MEAGRAMNFWVNFNKNSRFEKKISQLWFYSSSSFYSQILFSFSSFSGSFYSMKFVNTKFPTFSSSKLILKNDFPSFFTKFLNFFSVSHFCFCILSHFLIYMYKAHPDYHLITLLCFKCDQNSSHNLTSCP